MYLLHNIILLMSFSMFQCKNNHFRQEGSRVVYMNPKYMSSLNVFTSRRDRSSPYLTTINATILNPWGNNISLSIEYINIKLIEDSIKVESKFCGYFQMSWSKVWVKKYSDVPFICPIPAGSYHFIEVRIPPETFPIQLSRGDHTMIALCHHISTKEKIMELEVTLKFDPNHH